MEWIESQGGPLILLEESLLVFWEGTDPPSAGRVVRAESRASQTPAATDYDRACDVRRFLGTLEVGPGIGLVLSGQPYPTAWLPPQERSDGVLVRWNFAEDEESIVRAIRNVAKKPWEGPAVQINVTGPRVLFDAAMPGYDILTPFLRIPMEPGTYEVRAVMVAPDGQTSVVLHPFSKVE